MHEKVCPGWRRNGLKKANLKKERKKPKQEHARKDLSLSLLIPHHSIYCIYTVETVLPQQSSPRMIKCFLSIAILSLSVLSQRIHLEICPGWSIVRTSANETVHLGLSVRDCANLCDRRRDQPELSMEKQCAYFSHRAVHTPGRSFKEMIPKWSHY